MKILQRIMGRDTLAERDGSKVYHHVLAQSRKPEFFTRGGFEDSYDGRIELLTLNLAIVLDVLRAHGEQGERLSQAVFDAMRDDFDIALRGEGLSDGGVKKRIKPMIALFYTRLKSYAEPLSDVASMTKVLASGPLSENDADNQSTVAAYAVESRRAMADLSLGQMAQAKFGFAELKT